MESATERLKNLIAEMTLKSTDKSLSHNYFGYIFSRIGRQSDTSLPAIMGISPRKDGILVLLYNPDWFEGTDDDTMKKAIEHEGMHVLNKHIPRMLRILGNEARNEVKAGKCKLWNISSDCAINPIINFPEEIILAGKPFNACFPKYYGMDDNMSSEYYYFNLLEKAQEQQKKQKVIGKFDGDDQDSQEFGDGIGGAGQDYDIIGDHSQWSKVASEVADVNSLSRKIDSHIQEIIKDSVKNFKPRRGTLPAFIQDLINAALDPPKIPYYQLIRKLVKGSRFSKFKRSLTRINRKRTYAFIIDEENIPSISPFPGKTRDFTFNIVILIDTSGSMKSDDVREGLSGCKNIIEKDRHCKVTVLECDAELQKEYVLKRVSDIDFAIKGRGGTVLRPGIERAREINPDVMLCFTDGGCDDINAFARKELPKKIIWVVTKDGSTRQIDKTGFIVRID